MGRQESSGVNGILGTKQGSPNSGSRTSTSCQIGWCMRLGMRWTTNAVFESSLKPLLPRPGKNCLSRNWSLIPKVWGPPRKGSSLIFLHSPEVFYTLQQRINILVRLGKWGGTPLCPFFNIKILMYSHSIKLGCMGIKDLDNNSLKQPTCSVPLGTFSQASRGYCLCSLGAF